MPICRRQRLDGAQRRRRSRPASTGSASSTSAVDGIDVPEPIFRNEQDIVPLSMPGTAGRWATTRFVDPDDLRHDMHVTIVTFEPGGVIPFAETHVMEHGLYVLEGKAVYRLNQDWVEVEAGDYHVAARLLPAGLLCRRPGQIPLSALQGRQPAREARRAAHSAVDASLTRIITARPLTRENFAAFGDVIDIGRRQPLPDQWRQDRALPRSGDGRGGGAERPRADLASCAARPTTSR